MSYTSPPTFHHGDLPTAAQLNILSDNVVALAERLASMNVPSPVLDNDDGAAFVNVYRWLHYQTLTGSGAIIDPAGVGDTYTLAESTGAVSVFDLSGVDWLAPGRVYVANGCKYALEDREA